MSKRDSPYLRRAVYLACQSAVRTDPYFKAIYERQLQRGKPKRKALGGCHESLHSRPLRCLEGQPCLLALDTRIVCYPRGVREFADWKACAVDWQGQGDLPVAGQIPGRGSVANFI